MYSNPSANTSLALQAGLGKNFPYCLSSIDLVIAMLALCQYLCGLHFIFQGCIGEKAEKYYKLP